MQAQYQPVVEQAIETWAAASGLTLQEVANPAAADIEIGWGDFDTSDSNVIGYTTMQQSGGHLQPGVIVRMEDPDETALVEDADGQPAYADTGATLYQVALHEIGHALGLSDNSDPNSVMYYSLGGNNPTLDATDIAAIQAACGPPSHDPSTALLLQAIASFGAEPGTPPLNLTTPPPTQAYALAANLMH